MGMIEFAASSIGDTVITVELSSFKADMAAKNFTPSGLAQFIVQVQDDASHVLSGSQWLQSK